MARAAQRLAGSTDMVIIDTPGFRSQATLSCLGVSDFVLVPVKPSPFDIDRMLDTLQILINGVQRQATRVPLRADADDPQFCHCQTHSLRTRRSGLSRCFDSEMTNRVVYAAGRAVGRDAQRWSTRKGPAARDIAAIANEVDSLCKRAWCRVMEGAAPRHEQEKASNRPLSGTAKDMRDARQAAARVMNRRFGGANRAHDRPRVRGSASQCHRNGAQTRCAVSGCCDRIASDRRIGCRAGSAAAGRPRHCRAATPIFRPSAGSFPCRF